ncbi:AT-rich interactive domain-containing protein 5B-like [Megalops cyprinoides]|uniref:AT-rich interactive domain-containing protein 5B-like n=1 Tax=Megalops cyprinoides TaxID=118141 RepID=UPI001865090A|nr:AT-rich interactive domain-containing protein 5B-like [Megalops cyprinoides]
MSQEGTKEDSTLEPGEEMSEESFLKDLYLYMKNRDTPIERIPHLGFKQIDLFVMFKTVQSLGGYNQVTAHQLWKQVYNKLGGNPRSTSAATCTRRHYEKLILPYERYLRGEEDKELAPPRQQKRPRYTSFPHEEEEGMRGGKRSAGYGHMHTSHQSTHDLLADRVRIVPMPMHFRQYFHPGSVLPAYLPLSAAVPSPHLHPDPRALYPPSPQEFSERPIQQLGLLRELANEYVSSSGWAEPLNLSRKAGGMGLVSQQPSSFSPPGNNKTPKFLNKVVPLYPTSGLTKEEELGEPGNEAAAPAKHSPTRPVSPLPMQEKQVIDLTSSSTSSRRASPITEAAVKTEAFGPLPVGRHSSASTDTAAAKTPEPKEEGEPPKPSHTPLNLSQNLLSPRKGSTGRMEIQIPLSVLQDLLKGNFGSVPQHQPGATVLQSSEGEARSRQRVDPDVLPAGDNSSDLSSDSWGNAGQRGGGLDRDWSMASSFARESYPTLRDHYTTNGHHQHGGSPRAKAEEWEPGSDCRGNLRPRHLEELPKSPTGSNHYRWMYVQRKDMEARKPVSMGGVPEAHARTHPDLREHNPGSAGTLPLAYSPEVSHRPQLPVSGPPTILMVNPHTPSLYPLTQEEYLKLRRLISSSP